MRSIFTLFTLALLTGSRLLGQTPVLDGYIRTGLANNLVIKQQGLTTQQAMSSLREAKGLFMPNVQLNANYTSGYGGRNISFPIGDLLNPVYTTLNQMTQSNSFPQVENVKQNFFPENFYDVKLHTTVPIWNAPIQKNKQLQNEQVALQSISSDAYARELVRDIRLAYFDYGRSMAAIQLFQDALTLANEALRVNQSLLENGKGLPAYVVRAENEVTQLESKRSQALSQAQMAAAYFNFLLNRPLQEAIDTTGMETLLENSGLQEPEGNIDNRAELVMLRKVSLLQAQVVDLQKSQMQPRLGGFVDLGMQAENFKVNEEAPYILFGVQLDVPIFSGMGLSEKVSRANLEVQKADLKYEEVKAKLNLQAALASQKVDLAEQDVAAAVSGLNAARTYLDLMQRSYKEGASSFIETVEARQQWLQAGEQLNLAKFQLLKAIAELSYAISDSPNFN